MSKAALLLILITPILCQRPFYAGLQPIGYPADLPVTITSNGVNNRPADQQSFSVLNQKHIEEAMKNPQTYPQRPSFFNENTHNRPTA